MTENEYKNLSKKDQEMMEIKRKIPEIELAQIDESKIPLAPKEILNINEKRFHASWQNLQRREKMKEKKKEYIRPRISDDSLDWQKVWQNLGYLEVKRDEVFPHGEDKGLEDYEIEKQVINYKKKYAKDHELPKDGLGIIDPEEFPEMIDKDIRDLVLKINNQEWLKTTNCCSGHREKQQLNGISVISPEGFRRPFLNAYIDNKNPRSSLFINRMNQLIIKLKERYPFISGDIYTYEVEGEKEIKELTLNLWINNPPAEWVENKKREKGMDYFDDVPKEPRDIKSQIITNELEPSSKEDMKDEESYVAACTHNFHIWHYQNGLFEQYKKRYYDKYDFYRSQEAENIAKEFFEGVREIIDEIEEK